MGILATLRRRWRGHDERLAEQAYHDMEAIRAGNRDPWKQPGAGESRGPILGQSASEALAAEERLEREEPPNQ